MNTKPFIIGGAALLGAGTLGYLARDSIKRNVGYGSYLIPHKYHVYRAMREMDYPITTALSHDLSKFKPSQWRPYAHFFEDMKHKPDPHSKVFNDFRNAVRLHYKDNMHHWRVRGIKAEDVPIRYQAEALADWYGVRKTKRPDNIPDTFKDYYIRNLKDTNLPITPAAKKEIEERLKLASLGFKKHPKASEYIRTKLREV